MNDFARLSSKKLAAWLGRPARSGPQRAGCPSHCRDRTAGVEVIPIQKINEACERMVESDAYCVDVMKQETLAMTLRYKLGLTGTKLGCDRSECGACTVLIDDVPHYSCSILTHTVRGRKIQTIEGLEAADGTLHPVQQAVVDEQGFQCAFCMSGFIMSAVGFLKTNPSPTRAELAHGISGNLCRCADYHKILNSLMRGAENMRNA